MTRETKIGLLVGMGVIILIGILISDHLSEAGRQEIADLRDPAPELGPESIPAPPGGTTVATDQPPSEPQPDQPLPPPQPELVENRSTPAELQSPVETQASRSDSPEPAMLRQDPYDLPPAARTQPDASAQPVASAGVTSNATTPQTDDTQQVADIPQTPSDESTQIVHYVKKGESLSSIAREYYDDPNYWRTIVEANRQTLSEDPDSLRPGMRLVIPDKAGLANRDDDGENDGEDSQSARTETAPAVATEKYTVQSGESLSKIAARHYGSVHEWRKLYKLNKDRIEDPNRLKEGDVILVPSE